MKNLNSANEKVYFAECKAAAEGGDPAKMHELAKCYMKGQGTEENPLKAFYWYNKAAEKDDPDGMGYLSRCYRIGYGTEKNEEKADYWRTQSIQALMRILGSQFR